MLSSINVLKNQLIPLTLAVTLLTTRFKCPKFYILPTEYIYVFCVVLRTNSDYFTIQH
jgi:hypothetical protein